MRARILSQKDVQSLWKRRVTISLSLALTDWWWDPRDQWWDHQKHETFSGHRTDKEWWPQGSSVSEAGRRLSPRIWWVKLWKHPLLPWHDSMSLSPERQQESPFCFPIHQCLTSLSHRVVICLACPEISTHFILCLLPWTGAWPKTRSW